MLTLAISIKPHTGIRLAEVGEALGALGGLVLLVGAMTPFGRNSGQVEQHTAHFGMPLENRC